MPGISFDDIFKRRRPIFGRPTTQGRRFRVESPFTLLAPKEWAGTLPEFLVYRELVKTHRLRDPEDFTYQTRLTLTGGLPGRSELGGLIADFFLPARALAINPLGEFVHYNLDPYAIITEVSNRLALQARGILMVWIDSLDIVKDAKTFVSEALEGRDHSELARRFA